MNQRLTYAANWLRDYGRSVESWAIDGLHATFHLPQTFEAWGDVATLGMLSLMWWVLLHYAVKRTWRWERLGIALTIVVACLAISYSFSTVTLFLNANLWVPSVRWTTRIALFGAGSFVIVVMRFDAPPLVATDGEKKAHAEGVREGQEIAAEAIGATVVSAPVLVVPATHEGAKE
jgi:hypothetical protein